MATKKRKKKGDDQTDSSHVEVDAVMVIPSVSKGGTTQRRKKRGSSKASRRLIDVENRVSKSLHRVTKAVNRGVTTYRDKRDKSERRRRDGALVDFYENAAVGLSEAIAESSPVLTDVAKALNTRGRRKLFRRLIRSFPVPR